MDISVASRAERAVFYSSAEWRGKRKEVLARDNYECVWCKQEGKVTSINVSLLEIDHIQELSQHPELALESSNLRTLCKDCHNKRHSRMNYKHKNPKINKWQDERFD